MFGLPIGDLRNLGRRGQRRVTTPLHEPAPSDLPPGATTHAEIGVLSERHQVAHQWDAKASRTATRLAGWLARRRERTVRAMKATIERDAQLSAAAKRYDAFLAAHSDVDERARMLGGLHPWLVRLVVTLLAFVDLFTMKTAVEIGFNLPNQEWHEIVESLVVAALSVGIVAAASFCGWATKHAHGYWKHHLVTSAGSDKAGGAERFDAIWHSVLALGAAGAAIGGMWAGAELRRAGAAAAAGSVGIGVFWVFSALAAIAAFVYEYRYGHHLLAEHFAVRRDLRQATRRAHSPFKAATIGRYERGAVRLWGLLSVVAPAATADVQWGDSQVHTGRGHAAGSIFSDPNSARLPWVPLDGVARLTATFDPVWLQVDTLWREASERAGIDQPGRYRRAVADLRRTPTEDTDTAPVESPTSTTDDTDGPAGTTSVGAAVGANGTTPAAASTPGGKEIS